MPIYIAEISPKNLRGGLTTTNQVLIYFKYLIKPSEADNHSFVLLTTRFTTQMFFFFLFILISLFVIKRIIRDFLFYGWPIAELFLSSKRQLLITTGTLIVYLLGMVLNWQTVALIGMPAIKFKSNFEKFDAQK